jgi:hypothetical protein
MHQLLLLGGITIHYILEPQSWLKNHRQLPMLPEAIGCILLYFSLPLPVVVCEPYRVLVSCRQGVAWGVLVMGFLSMVAIPCCCFLGLGNGFFSHTDVRIVTARQHMAEEE